MKNTILYYLFMGVFLLSCRGQIQKSENSSPKAKIQLEELSNSHPNKVQMETLLNNYKEEFIQCETFKDTLKKDAIIQQQFCFQTQSSNVTVVLTFCENQKEALSIAEANYSSGSSTYKWGVNGATLFLVTGNTKAAVDDVLSYFSGEE